MHKSEHKTHKQQATMFAFFFVAPVKCLNGYKTAIARSIDIAITNVKEADAVNISNDENKKVPKGVVSLIS